jgi:hypothetical protein
MTTRQPHWDIDYAYGRQGELLVGGLLEGIRTGSLRTEVKRKRVRDLWFYVETEHNPFGRGWEPSGIGRSTADYYAFVVDRTDAVVLVPTARIRRAIALGLGDAKECRDGTCPTRGRLIHLNTLLATRVDS